jgi:hypothetical protein
MDKHDAAQESMKNGGVFDIDAPKGVKYHTLAG